MSDKPAEILSEEKATTFDAGNRIVRGLIAAGGAGQRSRFAPGGRLAGAGRAADTTADLFFGREPGWWHPHGQGFVSSLLGLPEWMELLHRVRALGAALRQAFGHHER